MRSSSQFLRYGLLALACQCLTVSAPAAEATVSVEFSVVAWQTDVSTLRYSTTAVVAPLESSSRSAVYAYAGPPTLRFYPLSTDLSSPTGKPPAAIGSVTFPPGATRFTLLAMSKGGGRYQLQALPEDGELLPTGFVRLHNFTGTKLRVTYDKDHAVQIPPAESAYIRPAGRATVIHVYQEDAGVWRKRFNNVVELNNERRGNIILAAAPNRPVALFNLPAWPLKGSDVPKSADAEPATADEPADQ